MLASELLTKPRLLVVVAFCGLYALVVPLQEDNISLGFLRQGHMKRKITTDDYSAKSEMRSRDNTRACSPTELSVCLEHLTTLGKWTEVQSDNSSHVWQVPQGAPKACRLPTSHYPLTKERDTPKNATIFFPRQSSTEDIQEILENRWIVMAGDSSVRMVFDYLVGRMVGNYEGWPDKYDNHGPGHSIAAFNDNPGSWYDFYWKGIRLTFIWVSTALPETLLDLRQRTIGNPDVVFAQYGYWFQEVPGGRLYDETESRKMGRYTGDNFLTVLFDMLETITSHVEMEDEYQVLYNQSTTQPHKVWMTLFDPWYDFNNNMRSQQTLRMEVQAQGAALAKELGWAIFNRSSLSYSPYEMHPMNSILEIELELVLAAIQQATTGGS